MVRQLFKRSWFILRPFVSVLSLLLLFYCCAVIIRFEGKTIFSLRPLLDIDSLPSPLDTSELMLSGRAIAGSSLDLQVNGKTVKSISIDTSGRFRCPLSVPPHARWLDVQLFRNDNHRRPFAEKSIFLSWKPCVVPASIDCAYWIADRCLLWVAGTATSGDTIRVYDASETLLDSCFTDCSGIFESTIDLPQYETIDTISLRRPGDTSAIALSRAVAVSIKSNDIPLHRSLTIGLPLQASQSKENSLQYSSPDFSDSSAFSRLLETRTSLVISTIELPLCHPALRAFIAGTISTEMFFRRTIGQSIGIPSDRAFLVFREKTGKTSPRFPYRVDLHVREGNRAVVTIAGCAFFQYERNDLTILDQVDLSCPNSFVLPCNDSVVVIRNGFSYDCILGQLPIEQERGRMVWTLSASASASASGKPSIALRSSAARDVTHSRRFFSAARNDSLGTVLNNLGKEPEHTRWDRFSKSQKSTLSHYESQTLDQAARVLRETLFAMGNLLPFLIIFFFCFRTIGRSSLSSAWQSLFIGSIFIAVLYALPLLKDAIEIPGKILFVLLDLGAPQRGNGIFVRGQSVTRFLIPVFWLVVAVFASIMPVFFKTTWRSAANSRAASPTSSGRLIQHRIATVPRMLGCILTTGIAIGLVCAKMLH